MKVSTCSPRPVMLPSRIDSTGYQIDPYVGCEHYCYYCYALKDAETQWDKEIAIHADIEGQLRKELENLPPQRFYMGYFTDPYQPVEERMLQTRKVLEILLEHGSSVGFLTKSNLFLRDLDLLSQMDDAQASISVAFLDDSVRTALEHRTVPTSERIDALRAVKENGVHTSSLLCPIIPEITDVFALLDMLAPVAETIWLYRLSIEDPEGVNWRNLRDILARDFPDKLELIESAVLSREHPYWEELRQEVTALGDKQGLNLQIHI